MLKFISLKTTGFIITFTTVIHICVQYMYTYRYIPRHAHIYIQCINYKYICVYIYGFVSIWLSLTSKCKIISKICVLVKLIFNGMLVELIRISLLVMLISFLRDTSAVLFFMFNINFIITDY